MRLGAVLRQFKLVRIGFGIALAIVATSASAADLPAGPTDVPTASQAAFKGASAVVVRQVADWIVASADNHQRAFMIVDKVNARLFLFDADGSLRTVTPVLLGLAYGDDSPPGVGTKKLAEIKPAERITPAGRFVTEPGQNLAGKDILWVDYDAAIALHRASDRKPGMSVRSRVERLASASIRDRRVSLGCINVSSSFYDTYIAPTFGAATGVIYILPETRSASAEFHIPLTVAKLNDSAGLS